RENWRAQDTSTTAEDDQREELLNGLAILLAKSTLADSVGPAIPVSIKRNRALFYYAWWMLASSVPLYSASALLAASSPATSGALSYAAQAVMLVFAALFAMDAIVVFAQFIAPWVFMPLLGGSLGAHLGNPVTGVIGGLGIAAAVSLAPKVIGLLAGAADHKTKIWFSSLSQRLQALAKPKDSSTVTVAEMISRPAHTEFISFRNEQSARTLIQEAALSERWTGDTGAKSVEQAWKSLDWNLLSEQAKSYGIDATTLDNLRLAMAKDSVFRAHILEHGGSIEPAMNQNILPLEYSPLTTAVRLVRGISGLIPAVLASAALLGAATGIITWGWVAAAVLAVPAISIAILWGGPEFALIKDGKIHIHHGLVKRPHHFERILKNKLIDLDYSRRLVAKAPKS
ncbi:MAG: hypothetical protein AABZ44_03925, partial [Elusimicrobiota bacterium]